MIYNFISRRTAFLACGFVCGFFAATWIHSNATLGQVREDGDLRPLLFAVFGGAIACYGFYIAWKRGVTSLHLNVRYAMVGALSTATAFVSVLLLSEWSALNSVLLITRHWMYLYGLPLGIVIGGFSGFAYIKALDYIHRVKVQQQDACNNNLDKQDRLG